MVAHLKKIRKPLTIALAVIVAAGAVASLELTRPYAVYADGTKID